MAIVDDLAERDVGTGDEHLGRVDLDLHLFGRRGLVDDTLHHHECGKAGNAGDRHADQLSFLHRTSGPFDT